MKEKLYAIKAIRKASAFVLSTDEETMMFVNVKGLAPAVILVALKAVEENLVKSIKELDTKLNEGETHGRKSGRRAQSRQSK